MSSHGGGNNRLDDQLAQLAEPGFPAIDDHIMGSTGPSGKKRRARAGAPRQPCGSLKAIAPGRLYRVACFLYDSPNSQASPLAAGDAHSRAGYGRHALSPLYPCRSLTVPTPERFYTCKAAPLIQGADDRIPAPPAHPGAGSDTKQRGDRMSTEQTQHSSTDTSPDRDLPEAAPARVSCSTCSPSVAPPWAD